MVNSLQGDNKKLYVKLSTNNYVIRLLIAAGEFLSQQKLTLE